MDPTTVCCPHAPGHASGHPGRGKSGSHAPQAPRVRGHPGHTTCSTRQGTICSRLRPAAEPGVRGVPWRAHGGPVPARVAAWGFAERPVAAGWARSGRQGQAGQASWGERPRALGPGHAEARRGTPQGGLVWRALALLGTTRVGRGGAVPHGVRGGAAPMAWGLTSAPSGSPGVLLGTPGRADGPGGVRGPRA
jgi:hypothetical protein